MNARVTALLAVALLLAGTSTTLTLAQAGGSAADEVIATCKAQWAADNAKDSAAALRFIADDYTEFNSDAATRLDGKALAGRLIEAGNKDTTKTLASEMTNAKVQVYGDVAILTYNFFGVSQDKDGVTKSNRAKSTRVYVKQSGKWMLVHANFGADPLPK